MAQLAQSSDEEVSLGDSLVVLVADEAARFVIFALL